MPLGIERVAAYVPGAGAQHGRAAPDEDPFTLAAVAVERLIVGTPATSPPTGLLLVGDLPSSADVDLPRLLGSALPVERVGPGPGAVERALRAGAETPSNEGAVLVVAVDFAADGSPSADGAVAVRLSGGASGTVDGLVRSLDEGEVAAAAPLLRFGAAETRRSPSVWVGDFASERGPPPAAGQRSAPLGDGPVSQGAYVPRPRYLENLGSRWRFEAEKCSACGTVGFPPRGRCRSCGGVDGLVRFDVPRDGGEVVASTTIGTGGQPTEFDGQVAATGPYGVVLVDLIPGVRVTLQVADGSGPIAIGSRVGTHLRRLYPIEGEWRYGRKAVALG